MRQLWIFPSETDQRASLLMRQLSKSDGYFCTMKSVRRNGAKEKNSGQTTNTNK